MIKYFTLSIGSFSKTALLIYSGNRQLDIKTFSRADLGIIAFIGNDTVVKFKFPDKICLPIYLISSLPIALKVLISFLFLHTFPPSLCAKVDLDSSFDWSGLKLETALKISSSVLLVL